MGAGLSLGTTGGSCFPEQSAGVGKEPKLKEAGAVSGAHPGDLLHAETGQNFEPESDMTGSGDQSVPALSKLSCIGERARSWGKETTRRKNGISKAHVVYSAVVAKVKSLSM